MPEYEVTVTYKVENADSKNDALRAVAVHNSGLRCGSDAVSVVKCEVKERVTPSS